MITPEPTKTLEKALEKHLSDRKAQSRLRQLRAFPTTAVDLSSNSYLSLSTLPEVRRSFLSYLQQYEAKHPTLPLLGSGGSRLLDGNNELAESLERDVAAFHHAPAGLLFNSGFDANVGLLSCVPQSGDIVIYDELVHASAHDGIRMSRAGQRIAFSHNSVSALEEALRVVTTGDDGEAVRKGLRTVIVVVEAVYSMDGHVAPLREIVETIHRQLPRGNGRLIVDEAHSTGIFGKDGRGLVCELGLEQDVFARLHTFGKALGGSGAIVLSSTIVREYLVNYARPLIYTTALPPACLAAIKVVYDALPGLRVAEMRKRLSHLTAYAHRSLLKICAGREQLIWIDTAAPRSPILPLMSPRPRELAEYCQGRGFVVRPIVAPTVPVGSERLRICLHAANTQEQVEALVSTVEAWALSIEKLERSGGPEQEKARL
ncbi:aminotransferase class I and II domain-containing protein [Sarocladium implicatum]|nr:aminotransferase class I and II domain-containing protein [Sarocladium implicatum]